MIKSESLPDGTRNVTGLLGLLRICFHPSFLGLEVYHKRVRSVSLAVGF